MSYRMALPKLVQEISLNSTTAPLFFTSDHIVVVESQWIRTIEHIGLYKIRRQT